MGYTVKRFSEVYKCHSNHFVSSIVLLQISEEVYEQ